MADCDITKEVEEMLRKFDSNGDGNITFDEVVKRLKETGSKDPLRAASSMFIALDKDKNGIIELKEVEAHKAELGAKKLQKAITNMCNNFLKDYDTNGDGNISWDEACDYVNKNNPDAIAPLMIVENFFSELDKDNDKVITKKEIKEYVSKYNCLPEQ
ncbi:hypothetical protein ACTFIZ_010302 [Dictyostelium cf. discoideum]